MPALPEPRRAARSNLRRVAFGMMSIAVLGLAVAAYGYSHCVLLENDCFLGREGACAALAGQLRFSAIAGAASLAMGLAGIIVARRSRQKGDQP